MCLQSRLKKGKVIIILILNEKIKKIKADTDINLLAFYHSAFPTFGMYDICMSYMFNSRLTYFSSICPAVWSFET